MTVNDDSDMGKILVIRFSSLGDLVLLLPMLAELRSGLPACKIDLVTKEEYASLLDQNPDIDSLHLLNGGGMSRLISLASTLRKQKYDVVIDAHNVIRSRLLSLMLPARKKIRIRKNQVKKTLLIKRKLNLYSSTPSIRERYLALTERLGVDLSGDDYRLFIPETARRKIEGLISRGVSGCASLVSIAPGARYDTKCWPEERFVALAGILKSRGYRLAFIGSGDQRDLCGRIAGDSDEDLNLAGKLSIIESAALLRMSSCLVTNDSAPLHIAEAAGTPVVAIFGPTVAEFGFFPHLKESIVIESRLPCRPCSRNGSKPCHLKTKECLVSISAETVCNAVDRINNRSEDKSEDRLPG